VSRTLFWQLRNWEYRPYWLGGVKHAISGLNFVVIGLGAYNDARTWRDPYMLIEIENSAHDIVLAKFDELRQDDEARQT